MTGEDNDSAVLMLESKQAVSGTARASRETNCFRPEECLKTSTREGVRHYMPRRDLHGSRSLHRLARPIHDKLPAMRVTSTIVETRKRGCGPCELGLIVSLTRRQGHTPVLGTIFTGRCHSNQTNLPRRAWRFPIPRYVGGGGGGRRCGTL